MWEANKIMSDDSQQWWNLLRIFFTYFWHCERSQLLPIHHKIISALVKDMNEPFHYIYWINSASENSNKTWQGHKIASQWPMSPNCCLGLPTITIFIWFMAAIIWYPIPYHQWSWGIVLTAINYTGICSSEIFPLSCVVLGCSMHFAMLAAHVTLFPVARPRIHSIWYGVWVKPITVPLSILRHTVYSPIVAICQSFDWFNKDAQLEGPSGPTSERGPTWHPHKPISKAKAPPFPSL